jgi:hypothetical protein
MNFPSGDILVDHPIREMFSTSSMVGIIRRFEDASGFLLFWAKTLHTKNSRGSRINKYLFFMIEGFYVNSRGTQWNFRWLVQVSNKNHAVYFRHADKSRQYAQFK